MVALRSAGCSVDFWGVLGSPDLVVGRAGVTYLIEVKQPLGPRGGSGQDGQQLNDLQLAWHRKWRGHVTVVRSVTEAFQVVGLLGGSEGERDGNDR